MFQKIRIELYGQLSKVPGRTFQIWMLRHSVILYGSSELNVLAKRLLMEATLKFVKNTKRLS